MQFMKKRFLTMVVAVLLAFVAATPALAASASGNLVVSTPTPAVKVRGNSNQGGKLNSVEEGLLATFSQKLDGYAWLSTKAQKNQYKAEARAALLDSRVDLDAAAEKEFNDVITKCDAIVKDCKTAHEAYEHTSELLAIINPVAGKYNMKVSVDASNKEAIVTISGGNSGSKDSGSKSVVASTAKTVKQTGYGLGQTAVVVVAAAAALSCAFYVARKSNQNA